MCVCVSQCGMYACVHLCQGGRSPGKLEMGFISFSGNYWRPAAWIKRVEVCGGQFKGHARSLGRAS